MKLCFPTLKDEGMKSTIYGHFASAPLFLEVDTDTGDVTSIPNCDRTTPEAGSNPFKALSGRHLDGVVVGGVGDGMLEMLNMMGFRVFEAQTESLRENVELFENHALIELETQNSAAAGRCDGVEDDHQCVHSHGDGHNCGSGH